MPNLVLEYATSYEIPNTPVEYIGVFLAVVGLILCLAALLVVAVSLHLLVFVEEEHLRGVFGEPYIHYCQEVPRYGGWRAARV